MNLEYFHPLFVHFPVALTLTGAVLLLYGTVRRHKNTLKAGLLVLVIGGAMVIPTYITGQVARAVLEDSSAFERDLPTLDTHEDLGLASLAVLVALGIVAGLTLGKWDPEPSPPLGPRRPRPRRRRAHRRHRLLRRPPRLRTGHRRQGRGASPDPRDKGIHHGEHGAHGGRQREKIFMVEDRPKITKPNSSANL